MERVVSTRTDSLHRQCTLCSLSGAPAPAECRDVIGRPRGASTKSFWGTALAAGYKFMGSPERNCERSNHRMDHGPLCTDE